MSKREMNAEDWMYNTIQPVGNRILVQTALKIKATSIVDNRACPDDIIGQQVEQLKRELYPAANKIFEFALRKRDISDLGTRTREDWELILSLVEEML